MDEHDKVEGDCEIPSYQNTTEPDAAKATINLEKVDDLSEQSKTVEETSIAEQENENENERNYYTPPDYPWIDQEDCHCNGKIPRY